MVSLVTVEDSILDDRIDHLMGKFDLILINPPFGDGKHVRINPNENGVNTIS